MKIFTVTRICITEGKLDYCITEAVFTDKESAKAFAKKIAILRLNFIDDEKAQLIVDKVKQKLGYPYYITGDKNSPQKLYCTTLLDDAIKEGYPKFSLQYQHVNQPIFKGDYLFVEAFFQIKDKTLLYQR